MMVSEVVRVKSARNGTNSFPLRLCTVVVVSLACQLTHTHREASATHSLYTRSFPCLPHSGPPVILIKWQLAWQCIKILNKFGSKQQHLLPLNTLPPQILLSSFLLNPENSSFSRGLYFCIEWSVPWSVCKVYMSVSLHDVLNSCSRNEKLENAELVYITFPWSP